MLPKTNASSRGISPAAALILGDAQKKIVDPAFRKREKALGLLPQNQDSPFGNFPDDYKTANKARPPRSSSIPPLFARGEGKQVQNPLAADNGTSTRGNRTSRVPVRPAGGGRAARPAVSESLSPPRAGAYKRRPILPSEFRRFYDRGDLPISVFHGGSANKISWKVDVEKLDYHHYLPIFFDGLREKEDPYRFLAVQGVYDMLEHGSSKILPVIPQLIIPIKTALSTRDPEVIATVLKALQALVKSGDMVGVALVPYYRQVLPVFNLLKNMNRSTGDHIDYSQRKR
eukprot:GHVT01080657.1.p1 GENE.GHVT01080657.1~~GHVT01080657.1.p1  ORF type:complete len:287 (-),score=33.65 GHVT01080657.1:4129-4989(-)